MQWLTVVGVREEKDMGGVKERAMIPNLKPYGSLSARPRARILIGLLALILPAVAEAAEPWQSDPIGIQGYNAYQGIDNKVDLDRRYNRNNERGGLAWGEGSILMGLVSMYEGTRNTAHLDRLVTHFDGVLSNRDDRRNPIVTDQIRGIVMPAWSSGRYTDGVLYAFGVHAGMLTAPVARFVYLVKSTPSLHAGYLAKALEYQTAITETVDAFDIDWTSVGADEGYYGDYDTGPEAAYNRQTAMGRTYVNLWLATGEERFRDRARRIANRLKNAMVPTGDRYYWTYGAGYPSWPADISYAGMDADFAFETFRAGIGVFSQADMARLAETLKFLYVPGQGFKKYLAGVGGYSSSYHAGAWTRLGYLDEEVREMLSDWWGTWPNGGWDTYLQHPSTNAIFAAYLVETSRDFAFEQAVPEPATLGLLAMGGVALLRRRRK